MANYYLFSQYRLHSDTDFQNTGLLPACAKLAVKYRPSDNLRHMQ